MSLLSLPLDLQFAILSLVPARARLRHVSRTCRALRVAVLRTFEGLTVDLGWVHAPAMVALFPRLLSMTIRHYQRPSAPTVFELPTSLRCLRIERLGHTLALSYPSRIEWLSFGLSIENEPTHLATCLRQCSSTLIGLELVVHEHAGSQEPDAWTVALPGVYLPQLQNFSLSLCCPGKVKVGHDGGSMTRVFSELLKRHQEQLSSLTLALSNLTILPEALSHLCFKRVTQLSVTSFVTSDEHVEAFIIRLTPNLKKLRLKTFHTWSGSITPDSLVARTLQSFDASMVLNASSFADCTNLTSLGRQLTEIPVACLTRLQRLDLFLTPFNIKNLSRLLPHGTRLRKVCFNLHSSIRKSALLISELSLPHVQQLKLKNVGARVWRDVILYFLSISPRLRQIRAVIDAPYASNEDLEGFIHILRTTYQPSSMWTFKASLGLILGVPHVE